MTVEEMARHYYPRLWSQPTGAHYAYNVGDVVGHNGILYQSRENNYVPNLYSSCNVVFGQVGGLSADL